MTSTTVHTSGHGHAPHGAPSTPEVQAEISRTRRILHKVLGKGPEMPLIDSLTCSLMGLTKEEYVTLPPDDKTSWRTKAAMIALPTIIGAGVGGSVGQGFVEILVGGAAGAITYRAIESSSVKALIDAENGDITHQSRTRPQVIRSRLLLLAFSAFIGLSTLAPKWSKGVYDSIADEKRDDPASSLALAEKDVRDNQATLNALLAQDGSLGVMSYDQRKNHTRNKTAAREKEKTLQEIVDKEIEAIRNDSTWVDRFIHYWQPGGVAWDNKINTFFGLGLMTLFDSIAFLMLWKFGDKKKEKALYDRYKRRVRRSALASDKPYDEELNGLIIDELTRRLNHELSEMRLQMRKAGSEGADYQRILKDTELQKLFDENIKDWAPVRQSVIDTLQALRNEIDEHDTAALEFVDGLIAHIYELEKLRQEAAKLSAQKGHKIGEIADDTRVHVADSEAYVERQTATNTEATRLSAGEEKIRKELEKDGRLDDVRREGEKLAGLIAQRDEANLVRHRSHETQADRIASFSIFYQNTFVKLQKAYIDSHSKLRQQQRSALGKLYGFARKVAWSEGTPGLDKLKTDFDAITARAIQLHQDGTLADEESVRNFVLEETAKIQASFAS